jgi:hypothetical protein
MTQYLLAIHHPDDYDASLEDEAMHRDIDTRGRGAPVFLMETLINAGRFKRGSGQ